MSFSKNTWISPFAQVPSPGFVLGLDYCHLNGILSKKERLDIVCGRYLASLSPSVKRRIDDLRSIQDQKQKMEGDLAEETAELEAKYEKLYQPLYAKRCEIVNGVGEAGVTTESAPSQEAKGVPNFWLIVLKNTQQFDEITYRDEQALKFLKDITSTKIDEKGFKLEFYFGANPYFKNPVLSRTYYTADEDDKQIFGTVIEWLPGQCLTEEVIDGNHYMASKDTEPIVTTQKRLSFFDFFETIEEPINENDANEFHNWKEREFNTGIYIHDKVIPKAVLWFTGEIDENDFWDSDEDSDEDTTYSDYTTESEGENKDSADDMKEETL